MAKYVKPLDEDESEDSRKYRLPFALCKARGIPIPEGCTPRKAWMLLKGYKVDPDTEYKKLYNRLRRTEKKQRKEQAQNPEHSPDYKYEPKADELAGVKKGEPMSFEQADGGAPNPNYNKPGLYGYETNCQTCVVAFEARQRGFDVRALPNNRNPYIKDVSRNTRLAWVDKDGNHPEYIAPGRGANKKQFIENTVKDGERYTVQWTWRGENSGHIISVQRENGELVFYDPQTSKKRNYTEFKEWAINRSRGQIKMLRVDNCELNPEYVNYMLKGASK